MKPISEDDRRLLVRQSYPYKTNGQQACESTRKKYALSEVSRVITSEGTVIKNMMDGSIQVMSHNVVSLIQATCGNLELIGSILDETYAVNVNK